MKCHAHIVFNNKGKTREVHRNLFKHCKEIKLLLPLSSSQTAVLLPGRLSESSK